MEELWRKIGAIRPHKGVQLGMKPNLGEHFNITQRLKHRAD